LPGNVAQKITWVLSIIEEFGIVPQKYFKKLTDATREPYSAAKASQDEAGRKRALGLP